MLIRNAEVRGLGPADVRLAGGHVVAIGTLAPLPGEPLLEAGGGALLPGLHDHHLHLNALAARRASVVCGPPEVRSQHELAARLRAAPGEGWIRGILYHESVMGLPDARALDRIVADRPLRLQHRSGRMWLLNSAGLERVLDGAEPHPALERADGRLTGRLFDADGWLRQRLGGSPPDLGDTSARLAGFGVTGVTEMSPGNGAVEAAQFAAQITAGRLRQRLLLAGRLELADAAREGWRLGPAKLHLHEAALPDLDGTVAFARAAHGQGRGLAVHCTTEVELVFALAVLDEAGAHPLDRVEHAGVASDTLVGEVAALGAAVVSQPHFIAERGAQYLRDVEPRHRGELYRLAAFTRAGVTLAAGSDAPFGSDDPWAAMRAAVSRRTDEGQVIGPDEALTPEAALALFLADPEDLGRTREIVAGAVADLCLLDRPWREARARLNSGDVRACFIAGELVHQRIDEAP
ncbi:MAG: amidohydrolase family protein [Sphingomonadales bacterium]|nr:amidohydrolase family protein [Sphingomonadales bacterium]